MREWLLKEEEKNKVGRPKLADNDTVKTAKKLIYLGFIFSFILAFSFVSTLKGIAPQKLFYSITFEKMFGAIENKNGFIVKNHYDSNYDYIIDVKVPISVIRYQGDYKYTLYKLNNNSWKKVKEKVISKNKKAFSVKINSKKNTNTTWKMKLELINASNVDKSFAPYNWTFVDSKDSKKYAYGIFTVRGYYSPVIDEDKKNSNIISVNTLKNNPRKFVLDLKNNTGNIMVYYTDSSSKKNKVDKIENKDSKYYFTIPNDNKVSYVTIKIKGDNLNSVKPNSWVSESNGNSKYIIGNYSLKPETSYNYIQRR